MAKELNPHKPRFKQTEVYNLISRLLMYEGVFRGVNFENLDSILDIGCGEAIDISFIAKNNKMQGIMVGLDIYLHPKWKNIILHCNNVVFIVADARHLPFRPEAFSFVFLKDVLHHIPQDYVRVIKEAFKVVKSLGILRVIEANRYHINPILVFKRNKSHDHFTFDQMRRLRKNFSFDELYGYELLPSFSDSKRDLIWNFWVFFLWFLTTWCIGRYFLFSYIKVKEKLMKGNLTYYVLSKRKRRC